MDPDSNLAEQREIVKRINAIIDAPDPVTDALTADRSAELESLAIRLAELVEALDQWLSADGFLPEDWRADEDKEQADAPTTLIIRFEEDENGEPVTYTRV